MKNSKCSSYKNENIEENHLNNMQKTKLKSSIRVKNSILQLRFYRIKRQSIKRHKSKNYKADR